MAFAWQFLLGKSSLPALFLGCFALSAFSVFLYPLNHDVSWILSVAEKVRHGTRLYVDIIEVGPPLIVWLNMPVSAAADLAHVNAGELFRSVVLVLALTSMALAARVLRGRLDRTTEALLLLVLCYAAVAAPGYDFGQREHLALLLSLPYLAMAVLRLGSESTSRWWRLGAALAAAVGFAIKPYFLLVPFLVEGLILLKTRSRPDGSGYVIAGFAALYLAAVLLFAPDYLPLAKMASRVYGTGFLGISPFAFLLAANFHVGIICAVFAWMVRPGPAGLFHVLSAAALGFAGSALVQTKGWSYHWYPFAAVGWVLFGFAAAAVIARRIGPGAAQKIAGIAVVVMSAAALVTASGNGRSQNPFPLVFAPVIEELGGGPVVIFSNVVRVSYPLVTLPGIRNASRLPAAPLLSAAISAKDAEFERYLRGIIVADMIRDPPRLLIVESRPPGLPPSFDFVEYLSKDPAFAREMSDFRLARTVANFRFYQRTR